MPYIGINESTHPLIGIWKIEEDEKFFEDKIDFQPKATNPSKRIQQYSSRLILEKLSPGFPLNQIIVDNGGKPKLRNSTVQFNVSHTNEFAAAIVCIEKHVGIDIEKIDKRVCKVMNKFLNTNELEAVSLLDENEKVSMLTLYWSIKETVYKWWGRGSVDFADHIRIQSTHLSNEGTMEVMFIRDTTTLLKVSCKEIKGHWLTYLAH
jgi:phosphopantetheine--protein transferase-like protein